MKIHHLAFAAAALGAIVPANAAVTVLGNGLAAGCYQAAEFGANPKTGIASCTRALGDENLTVQDRAATYVNRGILKARIGNTAGALDDCDQGLAMNAKMGEGYVDRGTVLMVLQRYPDALQDIDRGIAMGAHKPQIAYYDRAIAHEALGDVRGAYMDYKRAIEIEPDFALAHEQLARFKVVRRGEAAQ
jgi:tetratricopeptide (TPR) repeat protein